MAPPAARDAVSAAAGGALPPEDTGPAANRAGPDDQPGPAREEPGQVRGVVLDWGGVLTNPILDTVDSWLKLERISRESYLTIMRLWLSQAYQAGRAEDRADQGNPVHRLERGEWPDEEFERELAGHLVREDGRPVPAEGLLGRMFAGSFLDDSMQDLLRTLRSAGLKTALLSNSWGRNGYPRPLLDELFDAVVISCEVGMRKPEQRIFAYTTRLLGLQPRECVFVADVEANVTAARTMGFLAVHHRRYQQTAQRLTELIGIPLGLGLS